MPKNERARCVVAERVITIEDIERITRTQQNTVRTNDRVDEIDALEVALKGSKIYLEEHGLSDGEE